MKKMGLMGSCGLLVALITCAMTLDTQANMLIYPAKGQSPQQQQKDEYECHIWAVKQTGFDPTKAQTPPQQDAAKKEGALRGGARGALVGAGIGAIVGDAGKGAAIGATAGGIGGGIRQRRQNQQANEANQQTASQYQANLDNYNKAKSLCLEGRGYKVK